MQIYRSLDEVKEAGTIAPNSIVNADCLEAMKLIEDRSVHAIICDLPYGVTNCHWDSVIPFDLLWEQYKRIIKPNGVIVLFGSQPFTSALVASNPKWFKYECIWEKAKATGHALCSKRPLKAHENILVFCKSGGNYYPQKEDGVPYISPYSKVGNNYQKSQDKAFNTGCVRRDNTDGKRFPRTLLRYKDAYYTDGHKHPTQKPVPLIEYLLKTYTIEGELILDNTAGSGTLAIAAINTNRRYICIEKDPDYFEVMRNRIENHDPNALTTPKKTRKPRAITEGQLALFG